MGKIIALVIVVVLVAGVAIYKFNQSRTDDVPVVVTPDDSIQIHEGQVIEGW